ncbi:hypothetical protein BUY93_11725 [Mammaliicoccus fleurettii]|nr:hypothetical protein BUY93_11725 [Mammaliicoccus fleurettii]
MKENSNKISKYFSMGATILTIGITLNLYQDTKVNASENAQNDVSINNESNQTKTNQENSFNKDLSNDKTTRNDQLRITPQEKDINVQEDTPSIKNIKTESENTPSQETIQNNQKETKENISLKSYSSNINYDDSGTDIDAPKISNVTFDKKTYKPGETVKVTVESHDESEIGVQAVGIESTRYKEDYRYDPIHEELKTNSFTKNNNGNWVANFSYVLPARMPNDEFKLTSILSQDIHGNNQYNLDWKDVGFNVVNTVNNDESSSDNEVPTNPDTSDDKESITDKVNPNITSISVSSSTFGASQRFYVSTNASDSGGSGLKSVTAHFINTKTNEKKSYELPNVNNGIYSENIYLTAYEGSWELDYLIATDNAQNQHKHQYRKIKDVDPITNKPIIKTPTINSEVNDSSNYIIGTTDSDVKVIVKANGNVITTGKSNYSGRYVLIIPKQTAGTEITVIAIDKDGIESLPYKITLKDKTPPNTPRVKSITEKSTSVYGLAEANSLIKFKVNNKIIAQGRANKAGTYNINIPIQKANQIVYVTATDDAGNESTYLDYTVQDITSPNAPKLQPLNDKSNQITGTGESNTTVRVSNGNKLIAKGKVSSNGSFSIPIPSQTAGTVLNIVLDDGTNRSQSKSIEVTGTIKPKTPTVNTISDISSTISGKSINNVTIYAMLNNKVIGKSSVKNGTYTISISKQKAGTKLKIYAIDKYKNKSTLKTVSVIDKTPPKKPTISKVNSTSKVVTGKGEVGSTIYLYNGNKKIGQANVDKKGNYKLNIKKQKSDSKITIYSVDKSKNKSTVISTKVLDKTPPKSPSVSKVTYKSKVITGKGEVGSTVYIYNGNKKVGQATINKNGTYKLNIKAPKKGAKLKLYALDKSKNKSKIIYTTVK